MASGWLRLDTHSAVLWAQPEEAASWGCDLLTLSKAKCSSSHEMSQGMEWQGAPLTSLYFVFLLYLTWTPTRPRDQLTFSEIALQLTLAFLVEAFSDLLSVERKNPSLI